MGATFVQEGKSIDYTPTSAVTAGDVVVLGQQIGVAKLDIAANALGALAIEGVFDFSKANGDGGITAGAKCWWDAAEGVAKTNPEAGANVYIGKAVEAAGDTDTTVRIKMGDDNVIQAATVAAPAALTATALAAKTASAMPAGGTGSADGGWDTAAHRDEAIAAHAALVADVDDIRAKYAAVLADLTALRTTVANLTANLKTSGAVASA